MKLISTLFKRFEKPVIKTGTIGIYKYNWFSSSSSDNNINYNVFVKVKAINNFDGLIEVEVINIAMNETPNDCITLLIENNFPRYINQKYIKWETPL